MIIYLIPGRIGIWRSWFLRREENWSTRRKPLGEKERTNNKLNPYMASTSGFEPGPHWWEAIALTTAPSFDKVAKENAKKCAALSEVLLCFLDLLLFYFLAFFEFITVVFASACL